MPPLDPEDPLDRGRFDRAVVLFNAGAFYDAHEDWEDLWHEAEGRERLWLQGLIQVAAAFVHWSRGFHASGFGRLLVQAREKLEGYEGRTWGLDWPRLWADLEPWFAHGVAVAGGASLRGAGPAGPPTLMAAAGYESDPLPID